MKLIKYVFAIYVFVLTPSFLKAHEGMWIPALLESLNKSDVYLNKMQLSAEDIYSVNHSSIKDAIVHFGGFCTAELISKNGLLLTNHHCGYGSVQSHSSLENNYLEDGFWAKSHAEELANPGLYAEFIREIVDVTAEVFAGTDTLDGKGKRAVMGKNIGDIIARFEESGLKANVKAFYNGNAYYLIVSEVFNDVRLVGAPPSAIGKFGGDTDNWEWPRHTGDFSMFRIYADTENKAAPYNENNIPLKTDYCLPISLKGSVENEYSMVMGFPGSTDHFISSVGMDITVNYLNPARIEIRDKMLEVINAAMRKDPAIKIQYASKQASISNAWKKWIGQRGGIQKTNAIQLKQILEQELIEAQLQYGQTALNDAFSQLTTLETDQKEINYARNMFIEFIYVGQELIKFAYDLNVIKTKFEQNVSEEDLAKTIAAFKPKAEAHFKDYNVSVDKDVFLATMEYCLQHLPKKYMPQEWQLLLNADHLGRAAYVDRLYKRTALNKEAEVMALLDNPKKLKRALETDAAMQLMTKLLKVYYEKIAPEIVAGNNAMNEAQELYVKTFMDAQPGKTFWPDANSTLRVTFGKVEGTAPQDGVKYTVHTTLDGLMAKYVPGNYEFDVPERLLELYEKQDYGQYAAEDGSLVVCFLASNHTSGGNSGSPVINEKGQLIGLNFDRTWQSTMSDLYYDDKICRNIAVDIRYVLFVVDKYAGAKNLIEEMELN